MEERQPWQLWKEVDFNTRRTLIRNVIKNERERGQWGAAEQRYQRYSEECLDSGDWLGQAIALDELGSVYRKQGRLEDAEAAHLQSLEIYKVHDLLDGQAMSHHKLGKLYSTSKWWRKAETSYGESLRIKRAVKDDVGEVITLDNLAEAYQAQGRIVEAEETCRQSLGIIREVGTAIQIWETLRRLALLREEQKNTAGARTLVQEAVVLLEKRNKAKPLAEAQGLLGRLAGHTGDRPRRAWWRRVISIAFARLRLRW